MNIIPVFKKTLFIFALIPVLFLSVSAMSDSSVAARGGFRGGVEHHEFQGGEERRAEPMYGGEHRYGDQNYHPAGRTEEQNAFMRGAATGAAANQGNAGNVMPVEYVPQQYQPIQQGQQTSGGQGQQQLPQGQYVPPSGG